MCRQKGHHSRICSAKLKVKVNAVDKDVKEQYIDTCSIEVSYVNPLLLNVKLGGKNA